MLVKTEELLVGRSLWLDWTNLEHLSSAETWLNKKPGVNEVQINYLPSIITLFCLHKLTFPQIHYFQGFQSQSVSLGSGPPSSSCIIITSIFHFSQTQIQTEAIWFSLPSPRGKRQSIHPGFPTPETKRF